MTVQQQWVSPAQFRSIEAGLRVVHAWTGAAHEPEEALGHALSREADAGAAMVGLATISRLLAIELAAATGSTEREVLRRLDALVHRMQQGGPSARCSGPHGR